MVSDEDIQRVLACRESLDVKADMLMNMALAAGGRDNVTLILHSSEEV